MKSENEIQSYPLMLYFLSPVPKILFYGTDIRKHHDIQLRVEHYDIILYLALSNTNIHHREILADRLYDNKNPRASLRKRLNEIPEPLLSALISDKTSELIVYNRDQVWTDTQYFQSHAKLRMGHKPASTQYAIRAIDIYDNHLLSQYQPHLYKLSHFLQTRRRQFKLLFIRTAEDLIQTYLEASNFEQAVSIADKWYRMMPDAITPLQYIIVCLYQLNAIGSAQTYIEALARHTENEDSSLIYSADDWKQILKNESLLDLKRFYAVNSEIADDNKGTVLHHHLFNKAFNLLFLNVSTSTLAITGMPGVGQSGFADQLANLALNKQYVQRIIHLEVKSNASLIELLNALILSLELNQAIDWIEHNKLHLIYQSLQEIETIIIYYEADADATQSNIVRDLIHQLQATAYILIVCSQPIDGFPHVLLKNPSKQQMVQMLMNYLPRTYHVSHQTIEKIMLVTKQNPFQLMLLLSWWQLHQLTLDQLVSQIVTTKSLFDWMWNNITDRQRTLTNILYDFSSTKSLTLDEILMSMENELAEDVRRDVDFLHKLGWITISEQMLSSKSCYGLARNIHSFLDSIEPQLSWQSKPLSFYKSIAKQTKEYDDFEFVVRRSTLVIIAQRGLNDALLIVLPFVVTLAEYLIDWGFYDVATNLINLALKQDILNDLRIKLKILLANALIKQGNLEESHYLLEHLLRHQEPDPLLQSKIRYLLGTIAVKQGMYHVAQLHFEDVLQIDKSHGNLNRQQQIIATLGVIAYEQGQYDLALQHFEQATKQSKISNNYYTQAFALAWQGVVQMEVGNLKVAIQKLESSVKSALLLGMAERISYAYNNLGLAYLNNGDVKEAENNLNRSYNISIEIMHRELIATTQYFRSLVASFQRNYNDANQCLEQAYDIAQSINIYWLKLAILLALGKLRVQERQYKMAEKFFVEVIQQAHELNYSFALEALIGIAMIGLLENSPIFDPTSDIITEIINSKISKYSNSFISGENEIGINDIEKALNDFWSNIDRGPWLSNVPLADYLASIF